MKASCEKSSIVILSSKNYLQLCYEGKKRNLFPYLDGKSVQVALLQTSTACSKRPRQPLPSVQRAVIDLWMVWCSKRDGNAQSSQNLTWVIPFVRCFVFVFSLYGSRLHGDRNLLLADSSEGREIMLNSLLVWLSSQRLRYLSIHRSVWGKEWQYYW